MKDPKLLITIAMLYVAVALACDPLAYKVIDLKVTPIIGASILFPMLYAFVNIIAETYGQKLARFIVYIHIICDFVFTYTVIGIVHLKSPDWFENQAAYEIVLYPMGRLYIAGVIGSLSSFLINIYLLVKWKKRYHGKYFWLRSFIATLLSIIIYTTVTDLVAFSDVRQHLEITVANTVTNILFAGLYTICSIPVVSFLKNIIFDDKDNYKPFNPFNHKM